jgi:simple sugar transport system permease protein
LSAADDSKVKKAGQVFLEEVTGSAGPPKKHNVPWYRRAGQTILIPALAVITGLILGAILIALTTQEVYTAWGQSPGLALRAAWDAVAKAYGALFTGSIGDPARIIAALQSGDNAEIRRAFNPFLESLVASTPYIFGGLAVALGFRAGLFNIGAEGQIFVGAIFSAFVGYSITG